MRKRLYLICSILLISATFSCSVEHHINQIEKHQEKAEKKGAIFQPDTLYRYIIETDTLINTETNEIEIIKRIKDSIPYQVDRLIYVPMSRQERLALRDSMRYELRKLKVISDMYQDSLKHERKINRQDEKTERTKIRKENRSRWFIWLIIGMISGSLITIYLRKILS